MNILFSLNALELPLGIPVLASGGDQKTWPILNLVLWILGLILACGLALRAVEYRKQSELDEGDVIYKVNRILFAASIIFAACGALYFLLYSKFGGNMVLVDDYTIGSGALLVLEAVTGLTAFSKKSKIAEEIKREKAIEKTAHADPGHSAFQESDI